MEDRAPRAPGRVLITPEDGSAPFYATMKRADDPEVEGTPLNTSSLYKLTTAALFGLGVESVPDDATRALHGMINPLYLHWWRRRQVTSGYVLFEDSPSEYALVSSTSVWETHYYWVADSCVANSDGTVSLVSPTLVTVGYYDSEGVTVDALKNKYFWGAGEDGTGSYQNRTHVYKANSNSAFVNEDTKDDTGDNWYTRSITNTSRVTSVYRTSGGDWEYLSSVDDDAYPNGISGSTKYEYLGVPVDNAKNPVRVAYGSYVGTGAYGINNKNLLTFDFVPKLVIVKPTAAGSTFGFVVINGMTASITYYINRSSGGISTYSVTLAWDENTLSWYSGSDPGYQLNTSASTYYYIAIG